jgi:hypothetical protein
LRVLACPSQKASPWSSACTSRLPSDPENCYRVPGSEVSEISGFRASAKK